MTRWPPRPRPAPTASWPEANRSFFWRGGTPLASAQRGSPSPSPTPFPNARCSGRWRLRISNGLPSLTVPRLTTTMTAKKLGPQATYAAKSGWSYGLEHASARPVKYLLENASCPTAGKNEGSAKSTAKYKEPSSSPFPGNFQLSPRRSFRLYTSGETTFQKISPIPSPPYLGRPAAKAARRITCYCQKTIRAVLGGWGSLRGKAPFFRQKKGPSPSNPSLRSSDSPQ